MSMEWKEKKSCRLDSIPDTIWRWQQTNKDPFWANVIWKQAWDPRDGAAGCEYQSEDSEFWTCTVLQVESIPVKELNHARTSYLGGRMYCSGTRKELETGTVQGKHIGRFGNYVYMSKPAFTSGFSLIQPVTHSWEEEKPYNMYKIPWLLPSNWRQWRYNGSKRKFWKLCIYKSRPLL